MSIKTKKILFIASGIILTALAGTFFYAASSMPDDNLQWKAQSTPTTGIVVDLRQEFRNRAYRYSPVVDFQTSDGRTIRFYPNIFSSMPGDFKKGDVIKVRYRESNPESAYVDSDSIDTATIRVTWVFGAILLAAGFAMMVAGLKNRKHAAT